VEIVSLHKKIEDLNKACTIYLEKQLTQLDDELFREKQSIEFNMDQYKLKWENEHKTHQQVSG
jgi:hypothetical protein